MSQYATKKNRNFFAEISSRHLFAPELASASTASEKYTNFCNQENLELGKEKAEMKASFH